MSCSYRGGGTPAVPVDPPTTENVPATGTATLTLTLGGEKVQMDLDRAAAPCTVHSFVSLAEQGYYTGTSCHRLTTEGIFVLQCGDPTGTGTGGPGYVFDDELEATTDYPAGTIAMANAGPETNGSQFFLVYEDTDLPPAYTVFGQLTPESLATIADIAYQGHDASRGNGDGVPNAPTEITEVVSG
ncbi:MAG: peptidylprolyl isomerase [Propioniciclava sp.]